MPESGQVDAARPRRRPVRRRWWVILLRALAVLGVLLVLAYVGLPWWAPKQFLAQRLAHTLSQTVGVPVTVDKLDLSWQEGVTISGLRIASEPGFGDKPMIDVGSLRCELSPLATLFRGRLNWAEVRDARLHVAVNDDGQVNLAILRKLGGGGAPPDWLVIHDARVTTQLPKHDRQLQLEVSDLQYQSGSIESVGRITLSAQLVQQGGGAPVTLLAASGEGKGGEVASCHFRFSSLDLGQLNLPLLLGLPLKKLEGGASGELDCRVNSQGVVNQFDFSLTVKDLDAQPKVGPPLPKIDQAQISLSTTYDWYSHGLDCRQFRLRLPGVDLRGVGKIHAGLLTGGWKGVRSLELAGSINPVTVMTLLSGKPAQLPGGMSLDGDLDVHLTLSGGDTQLTSNIVLDATSAAIKIGDRVAKPAKRPLTAQLQSNVDLRSWQFSVDQTELRVGGNVFYGRGAMQNIRRVLGKWLTVGEAGEAVTMAMIQSDLGALDWQGSCRIVELESLRDLLGPPLLDEVSLTGSIDGQLSIEHTQQVLIRGQLKVPADTKLQVGSAFVKPAGRPLVAELAGDVAMDEPRLSRLRMWLGVGDAGLGVENGLVSLAVAQGPGGDTINVAARGDYVLQDAAGVLACLPGLNKFARHVSGEVKGQFNVLLSPAVRRIHVEAAATPLALEIPELLSKPAGQPAEISADFLADAQAPSTQRNRIGLRAAMGWANIDGGLTFGADKDARPVFQWNARLQVTDAAWMLQRVPPLAASFASAEPRGAMDLASRGRFADGLIDGELSCDADNLQFKLPATGGSKSPASALRFRLVGQGGGDRATIQALNIDAGRSSLTLSGTLTLNGRNTPLPTGVYLPPPGVAAFDLSARGRLVIDNAFKSLLPDLADLARHYGLEGTLRGKMDLHGTGEETEILADVDAAEAGISVGDLFRKPPGSPVKARLELVLPSKLGSVHLRDFSMDTGTVLVRGGGKWPLLAPGKWEAHLGVNLPALQKLAGQVPMLVRYSPTGGAFLDIDCNGQNTGPKSERYAAVSRAGLAVKGVTAEVKGKTCRLDGNLAVENLTLTGTQIGLGRVFTESMDLSAGDNRAFVILDLKGLALDRLRRPDHPDGDLITLGGSPAGRFHLLGDTIDAYDIQQWIAPQGLTPVHKPLTAQDVQALGQRADQALAAAKKLLANADLLGRFSIQRLRHVDNNIKAFYEVHNLQLDVEGKDDVITATARFGLNGGMAESHHRADLKDKDQRMYVQGNMQDLTANESIVLQVAREFPGNTVRGTFSRQEDIFVPQREAAMSLLDDRFIPTPRGKARTITENGVLKGKGGPDWMTRIFPGLNLTTYNYKRMTAFAEMPGDGSSRNDMIFDGADYNVWIEGTTDAKHIGNYDMGVLLSGGSPEALHNLRQGRIPIMKFQARIENGKFYDEKTWYPWPTETAYKLFLENNIFYRLWLSAKDKGGLNYVQPNGN